MQLLRLAHILTLCVYLIIQANLLNNSYSSCKKGTAKYGSPTQDGQG